MAAVKTTVEENVIWKPLPKQEKALLRQENEILFGGSRGGGKTDTGMAWPLFWIHEPRFRCLVIRRNADDLRDWVDRARTMYAGTGAQFVGNPIEIKFPSGAVIRTGHLKDENAYSKYQGHEYQKIVIEELTHIPRESDYESLLGSNRSTIPEITPQIFATTNPDGPGHDWVKRRWNIPDNPEKGIFVQDEVTKLSRVFIPSRLTDNPKLSEIDKTYELRLKSIQDEDLRNAWLNGSWADFNLKGTYYSDQVRQLKAEGRFTNIPYEVGVPVQTWWDLGMGDSTAIGFFQRVGKEWRLIDYYEAEGEGLPFFVRILQQKPYIYSHHYAPHDISVRELGTGRSRLETAQELGLNFEVGKKFGIEEGIDAVRRRMNTLWIDKEKCGKFMDAISQYRKEFNEKMGVYKNKPLHDWTSHAADMLRYWAMTEDEYTGRIKTRY